MVISANCAKGWLWTRGGVQYHSFLLGMCLALTIGGPGRYAVGYWPKLALDASLKPLNDRLLALGYALARVWFALLILPSGYEKVFENGAARIAAGNIVKTGFYPTVFWARVLAVLNCLIIILRPLALCTRVAPFLLSGVLGFLVLPLKRP